MPLKWVLHWQPNAGTTVNSQIINEVTQCVESINGVREGRWKATITFYKPILREPSLTGEPPRDFLGIALREQPSKYYLIMPLQRIILEADSSIQTIMEKLQSYKSRVWLYFEGLQYQVGDFQLRVGKVIPAHSENLRGIVMELEYLPISLMEKVRQVMEEFMDVWQQALSEKGHYRGTSCTWNQTFPSMALQTNILHNILLSSMLPLWLNSYKKLGNEKKNLIYVTRHLV